MTRVEENKEQYYKDLAESYEKTLTKLTKAIAEQEDVLDRLRAEIKKEDQKQKCESCFIEKLTKEKWASAKDCKKCKHFTDTDEVHGYTPCGADLRNFETKQADTTDGDEIKAGDEVRMKGSDPVRDDCDHGICTWSLPNVNTIYVMHRDGSSGQANKDEWYRTGRNFPQIAEILKLLRGENE